MFTIDRPRPAGDAENDAAPTTPREPLRLRRPWLLIGLGLALLVLALATAGGPSKLKAGGFDDASSDSSIATAQLEKLFPESQPNLVVLVSDADQGVGSARAKAAGAEVLAGLKEKSGLRVISSWFTSPNSQLVSRDRTAAATLIHVDGDEDTSSKTTRAVYDDLHEANGAVTVTFGGITQINNETSDLVDKDLLLAESIALPLTLLLLLFVFRGAVAALVSVGVSVLSVIGSLGILNVLSQATDVSIFAVQLVTTLGLGLAVDYTLLVIARYREERGHGHTDREAIAMTLRTAGRTVLFSSAVLAGTLAAMLLFPLYFLRSSAYAGLAVLAMTLIGALLVLPSLLLVLGDRIDKWSLPLPKAETDPGRRRWGRIAGAVMRRPVLYAVPVVGVLLVLMFPSQSATFGVPDQRMLPATAESRIVQDTLDKDFPQTSVGSVSVVSTNWADRSGLAGYARELSQLPDVDSVASAAGVFADGRLVQRPADAEQVYADGDATWLQVGTSVTSYSDRGERLAENVRGVAVPDGAKVLVGGAPAQLADTLSAISDWLPIVAIVIIALTLGVLFLLTGSIVLPIKALVLNLLSLGSVFGAMVWTFQQGHLANLLGVTPAPIPVAIPVLFFCVAFGLSMDYEVFLLSRIKEGHDRRLPLERAVREGIGASGAVITMAAGVLAISFFSMAVSDVTPIKLFGLATGVAILIDAFVVRGVLVPAFMKLVGRFAWYAPRALHPLYRRFGLKDPA